MAGSFFFGYALSQLTNIGDVEPGFVIPMLAGATFGVAAWFLTRSWRLGPSVVARSSRRPMLHRLHRDFAWGLLTCFTVCLFFGLVLGTVGGAVAGWRAEMNESFPAGSTVTTESNGTRVATDPDGLTYRIAPDGTKTAEPPNPVSGVLIVNPRGSSWVNLPDGAVPLRAVPALFTAVY